MLPEEDSSAPCNVGAVEQVAIPGVGREQPVGSLSPEVQLLLVDLDYAVCAEWAEAFASEKQCGEVFVHHGTVSSICTYDCIILPSNSFGICEGDIPDTLSLGHGTAIQDAVQAAILKEYGGEQPVGTSLIVPTPAGRIAHTPLMRVPEVLNPATTDVPYVAMKAALGEVRRYNNSVRASRTSLQRAYAFLLLVFGLTLIHAPLLIVVVYLLCALLLSAVFRKQVGVMVGTPIRTVVCCGLGSSKHLGRLPPSVVAEQMALGWAAHHALPSSPPTDLKRAVQLAKQIDGTRRVHTPPTLTE